MNEKGTPNVSSVKNIPPEFNSDINADCIRFEVEGRGEMLESILIATALSALITRACCTSSEIDTETSAMN